VIVLHGEDFDSAALEYVEEFARSVPQTKVLAVPSIDSLGTALNIGIEYASGSLVTKMDDDD
jgi:glycosyltransferase involved in cell wall biosynthesis